MSFVGVNRVINQKDVEIHNLTSELAIAKERIKAGEEDQKEPV